MSFAMNGPGFGNCGLRRPALPHSQLEPYHRPQPVRHHRFDHQVEVVPLGFGLVRRHRAAGDDDGRNAPPETRAQRVDRFDAGGAVVQPVVDDQQVGRRQNRTALRGQRRRRADRLEALRLGAPATKLDDESAGEQVRAEGGTRLVATTPSPAGRTACAST